MSWDGNERRKTRRDLPGDEQVDGEGSWRQSVHALHARLDAHFRDNKQDREKIDDIAARTKMLESGMEELLTEHHEREGAMKLLKLIGALLASLGAGIAALLGNWHAIIDRVQP